MKGLVAALRPIGRAVVDAAQIACILAVTWAIWRSLGRSQWTWNNPVDVLGVVSGWASIVLLLAIAALGAFGTAKCIAGRAR